jgi:hypothetical protein
MANLPTFFGSHKHKRFNFQPRYYDEQKEDLEQRIRQIESELGVDHGKAYVPKIRKGQMGNYIRKNRKKQSRQSNLRLFIIILVLSVVAWLLFFR